MTKEAFQGGVLTLGATKQPLPSFGLERAAVKEHGAVQLMFRCFAFAFAFIRSGIKRGWGCRGGQCGSVLFRC